MSPYHYVEVRLDQPPIRFFGTLAQSSGHGAAIHLLTVPGRPGLLENGTLVEVVGERNGAVFAERGRVVDPRAAVLVVTFDTPGAPGSSATLPGHAQAATECDLAAQYRTVRDDGRAGAWHDAIVVGLSTDQVRLRVDARGDRPQQIEVLFYPPASGDLSAKTTRTYSDDGATLQAIPGDNRPIRATTRVVAWDHVDDSEDAAVAMFTGMTTADRQRLRHLLDPSERLPAASGSRLR